MPCSDGGWPSSNDTENSSLRSENNELTEMLCSTCCVLEKKAYNFDLNPLLSRWWDAHKKEDERKEAARIKKATRRKMAVEASKKAVADLTAEDKKLLREFDMI
jgi:hypothetical protein